MKEVYAAQSDRPIARELGVGALAKCGVCPLLELCAARPVPPCEEPETLPPIVDSFAENDRAPSYRQELFDNSVDLVMARPRAPKPPVKVLKKLPESSVKKPAAVPQRSERGTTKKPPRRAPRAERRLDGGGEIVADILGAIIGVNSLAIATSKNKPRK